MEEGTQTDISLALMKRGYKLMGQCGKGKYGNIYHVVSQKYKAEFAVKRIKFIPDTETEFEILMQLSHPSIIKVYDHWRENDFQYMVLTYCENGSLANYIKEYGPLNEDRFRIWGNSIIDALNYCHKRGIVHSDIKPENILIDRYNRVYLADFGLSFKKTQKMTCKAQGTPKTMAPEVFCSQPYDPYLSDIWSLGITFYIMAAGSDPWDTFTYDEIKKAITHNLIVYKPNIPYHIRDIIKKMLVSRPENRISLDSLKILPFFSSSNEDIPHIKSKGSHAKITLIGQCIVSADWRRRRSMIGSQRKAVSMGTI